MQAPRKRWTRLWRRVADSDPVLEYAALENAYQAGGRFYHTLDHILDCLDRFDEVRDLVGIPEAVELAIWFHDVVYKKASSRNEADSATWASASLMRGHGDRDLIERVNALILATRHSDTPVENPDEKWMVDIDLSILGRSADIYDRYEAAIRKEYRWVPPPLYRRRRAELLRSFLQRPRIFLTDPFFDWYEAQARRNLARAVAALER